MSNALVRVALESRLLAWAMTRDPVIDPATHIAWENARFTTPKGVHLRVYLLPAVTSDPSLGTLHRRYQGLFQVNIYDPDDSGPATAAGIADEIEKLYPRGLVLPRNGRNVQIPRTPEIAAGQITEDGYFIPVRIRYRCDVITT